MKFLGYKSSINHKINLLPGIKPLYKSLYNISKLELAILRDYIKINLISNFIQCSSSSTRVPILFIKKKDDILHLIIDYKGLNSIIIKDHYPLPLILDILDYLIEVKVFIKFNLIITYNKIRIKKG